MATIFDVNANELIEKLAIELKKNDNIKSPEWANYVKTGMSKDRLPVNIDWWYVRAASILRKIFLNGPIGVSKLRTYYGSKKRRGFKPPRFYRAAGNHIRKIMQQLEKAELIEQKEVSKYKGRVTTKKGEALLNKVASEINNISIKKETKTDSKDSSKKKKAKQESTKEATKETKKETKKEKKETKTTKKETKSTDTSKSQKGKKVKPKKKQIKDKGVSNVKY
jgi:small subunit ribosomal protein S19e